MTISYKPGDVIYAPLDYVGGIGSKPRPTVVLLDTGDLDVTVLRVTSHPPRDSHDVQITDLSAVGLLKPSIMRISKITTIPRAQIIKKLGALSASDRAAVQAILQKLTNEWK